MTPEDSSRVVTELFQSHYAFLLRLVLRRTESPATAEELVQDALTALYEELRRGVEVRQPRAWVVTVLYRMLSREHSRQHREAELLEEMQVLSENIWQDPIAEEADGGLEELLGILTPREREVVLLRVDSFKYRQIAEQLGISKNSVNTLLARALEKLQNATRGILPGRPAQNVSKAVRRALQ
jgi:RNA polymerase sigma factor (sigma-70 family)